MGGMQANVYLQNGDPKTERMTATRRLLLLLRVAGGGNAHCQVEWCCGCGLCHIQNRCPTYVIYKGGTRRMWMMQTILIDVLVYEIN